LIRAARISLTFAWAGLLAACAVAPRTREAQTPSGPTIAAVAERLVGTPYRFGADGDGGFDCSGLAAYAYESVGISIPRTAAEQALAARPVALRDLEPGDLLFFRIDSRRVDHVGVYVGGGRFIHAPQPGALVSYASLSDRFFRSHLVGAGRFERRRVLAR
jgi:cell wall-associated NlpC family hydrolase